MSNINFDFLDNIGTSPLQPKEQREGSVLDTAGSITTTALSESSTNLLERIDQAEIEQQKHDNASTKQESERSLDQSETSFPTGASLTQSSHITNDQASNAGGLSVPQLSVSHPTGLYTSSRPGTASSDIQVLLDKQNEKLAYTARLNELIKVRQGIKLSIEEVTDKIKTFKDNQRKNDINKKLKGLLKDSNRDFIDAKNQVAESQGLQPTKESSVTTTRDTTPSIGREIDPSIYNGKATADNLIKELNVLPSSNWYDRIDYVRKFYPHLDVERIKSFTSYKDNNTLLRCINFVVVCPLMFQLGVDMKIHSAEERIDSIMLNPIQLTTLRMLSPSVTRTLVDNYARRGKIDLVMYCLNSLSILGYRRIITIYKIIKKFGWYIEDERFVELTNTEKSVSNRRLFAILKAVNNINLILDKNSEIYQVSLFWDIVLDDTVLGNSDSILRLSIVRKSDSHNLNNVDSLFQSLIKEYGVVEGLQALIQNVFGINLS